MLVLTREQGQSIVIRCGNEKIKLSVLRLDHKGAKLGFKAPPNVSIDREEIYLRKRLNGELEDDDESYNR